MFYTSEQWWGVDVYTKLDVVGIYHAQTFKSKFLRTNLAKSSENKFVLC